MKTQEQDLSALISAYLDNALSAEETGRLMEAVRSDPAAADLLCELSIQHVQLRRLFKKDEGSATRPAFRAESVFARYLPAWRPLALAAGLAIIVAAGFWLAGFLRERGASHPCSIVLLKIGQHIGEAETAVAAADGTQVVVPDGTIQILRFRDGTMIQLEQGAIAQVVDDGFEGAEKSFKTVKLTSGMLMADVASQPAEFPLRIITPHVEVIVAGTRFTCKAEADHSHVRMHQGWAHVVSAINGAKVKLESTHHVTAGHRFHFNIRAIHEDEH